jgi:hypothetical protein
MYARQGLAERIRTAVNREIDKRSEEIEMGAAETSEVHITVKIKKQKAWRVLFSRLTESDLE